MVWILNGIWNSEAQPFKIWANNCHFVKNHLKFGKKTSRFQMVWFQMVVTIAIAIAKARPFESWLLKSPDFRSPLYIRYSDPTEKKQWVRISPDRWSLWWFADRWPDRWRCWRWRCGPSRYECLPWFACPRLVQSRLDRSWRERRLSGEEQDHRRRSGDRGNDEQPEQNNTVGIRILAT